MKLAEEIRELLANSDKNTAYRINNVSEEYPAWVIRFWDDRFGVAVPYSGPIINENFANASLYSEKYNFGGTDIDCLFLTSSLEKSRNEFAVFCRDFVYEGTEGKHRKALTDNPIIWWEHWKLLIGNSILEKRPYAVLGELVMYDYLLDMGYEARWEGPKLSSHDLVCPNVEFEVKSTLSRYDKTIHISGQFQLKNAAKRLVLYFCRFEKNINGICINDMVERLANKQGESIDELNGKLNLLGYGKGSSARKEKYIINEVMQYAVDDKFPRIIPEMFKTGALPVGIKQLSYDVDLSLLDGDSINISV